MRTTSLKMISTFLLSAVLLSSCGSASTAATAQENTTQDAAQATTQVTDGQENTSSDNAEVPAQENEASNASAGAEAVAADSGLRDLYAMETYDTVPAELLERHDDVDYGTIDSDVEYYSETAGDNKYCNVLLPTSMKAQACRLSTATCSVRAWPFR